MFSMFSSILTLFFWNYIFYIIFKFSPLIISYTIFPSHSHPIPPPNSCSSSITSLPFFVPSYLFINLFFTDYFVAEILVLWLLQFCCSSLWCSLSLKSTVCAVNVLLGGRHSMVNWSLHFDKCWLSLMVLVCSKNMFPWEGWELCLSFVGENRGMIWWPTYLAHCVSK